jgi:galactokinase
MAATQFVQKFGYAPQVRAHAPGRLEFIGNHVDYNGGPVLGAAIDRGVQTAAARRTDQRVRVVSSQYDGIVEADLDQLKPLKGPAAWANYSLGVAWALAKNGCVFPAGFDLAVAGDLPPGAGLSSSAALELSTAMALGALFGFHPEKRVLANWCRQAENDFVGVPCGILDQGCSAFGQAGRLVLIDCRAETFGTVPLPESVRFWVFNTGKKHALLDSMYATRRGECEDALKILRRFVPKAACLADITPADVRQHRAELRPAAYQRVLHVTTEITRVQETVQALEKGDLVRVGRLLVESHQSSRTLFENSIPELDFLVDHLVNVPGVYGARLTGGGFGGAVMAMTNADFNADSAAPVAKAYADKFDHAPTIFTTRTGDGARVLA